MVKTKNVTIDSTLLFKRYSLQVSSIKEMKAKLRENIRNDVGSTFNKIRYIKKPTSGIQKWKKTCLDLNGPPVMVIQSNDEAGGYFTSTELFEKIKHDIEIEQQKKYLDKLRDKIIEENEKEIKELEHKITENNIQLIEHNIQFLRLNDKETMWLMCLRQALEIISEANSSDPEQFKAICNKKKSTLYRFLMNVNLRKKMNTR